MKDLEGSIDLKSDLIRLPHLLEDIDELVATAFYSAEPDDPVHRYLVYCALFQGDLATLGPSPDFALAMLRGGGDQLRRRLSAVSREFSRLFTEIFAEAEIAFDVINYWSPIDSRRRSIIHRRSFPNESERRRSLTFAYGFHALTLQGDTLTPSLTSAIHYLGVHATRKRCVTVSFLGKVEEDPDEFWLIISPACQNALLVEMGVDALIGTLQELDSEQLAQGLASLLSNDVRANLLCASAVCLFFDELPARLETLSHDLRECVEGAQKLLASTYGTQLTFVQAAMMVATYLVWREACPCNYMYAFPTHVKDTCCVLTIGTDRPLTPALRLAASMICRSLFVHPLLRDYATKDVRREAREQLNTSLYNFSRMIGHNFPKLFTTPFSTQLQKIEEAVRGTDGIRRSLTPRLEAMRVVIEHYENLFRTLIGGASLRDILSRLGIKAFKFSELKPKITSVYELLRESRLERDIVGNKPMPILESTLKLELPDEDFDLKSSPAFVLETIFNLLHNALSYIDARDLEREPQRGTISVSATRHPTLPLLRIDISDRGIGFQSLHLAHMVRMLTKVKESGEEDLWQLAEAEVASSKAREEQLGIGLVLSAVFLRSLEWNSEIRQRGWIEASSRPGEGSTMSLLIPRLQ